MQIINTAAPLPSDTLSQLAAYSGLDVLTLFEIKDGLSALMDEARWKTYEFELELQSPLLAMSLVGIPVDEAARREMTIQFTKEQTHLTVLINKMLSAIGYFEYYRNMAIAEFATHVDYSPLPKTWDEWLALPIQTRRALKEAAPEALVVFQKALKEFSEPFNPVSPAQKLKLFYSFFGSPSNTSAEGYFFPPPWLKTYGIHEHKTRNTKNEYEPAANREALEKIIKTAGDDTRYAAYWAAPFAHVCLAISDLSKSLGFLNCKLENGLFKASFGAVTETGRLSSRQNVQGFGCFPPGAEALTQAGWKLIEHITDGELVMQSDSYGNLSWAPADTYSATFEGKLHHVQTEQASFTVTPEHRLLMQEHTRNKGDPYVCYATKLFEYNSTRRVTTSGRFEGTNTVHPLVVALLADGSQDGSTPTYWRISFKKIRKINRFLQLIKDAGLSYNELKAKEGYRCFSLHIPPHWPTQWGEWVLSLSLKNAKDLLHELGYWDGTHRGDSIVFYTAKKHRAKWVQTLAHLVGYSSTIVEKEQSVGSWSDTLMYHVNIRPRDFAIVEPKHKSYIEYAGPVYCLTVPSSYFLVRQHDKVFITGNSNAQNVTPKLRHIFIAPPNEKFIVADYAQIESRVVAAICYRLFGATNYLAMVESGDAHSLCSSMVWDDLPWPKDFTLDWTIKHGPFPKDMLKAAKKLASEEFYRGKSRRDVSKTLAHGSNYLGRPPQMAKHSHIDIKLIEHYQSVYFSACPELPRWHQWVVQQVQTKGEIVTMLGRARRFFGRPNDDATIREAVAYEPQSVAADYCNESMLRLHKLILAEKLPATLRLSKHDELVVTCKEKDEALVCAIMREQMEEKIIITSPNGDTRSWFVPAEVESGWNLGRLSKDNPNGIGHPLDGRKRIETPTWESWKL